MYNRKNLECSVIRVIKKNAIGTNLNFLEYGIFQENLKKFLEYGILHGIFQEYSKKCKTNHEGVKLNQVKTYRTGVKYPCFHQECPPRIFDQKLKQKSENKAQFMFWDLFQKITIPIL